MKNPNNKHVHDDSSTDESDKSGISLDDDGSDRDSSSTDSDDSKNIDKKDGNSSEESFMKGKAVKDGKHK